MVRREKEGGQAGGETVVMQALCHLDVIKVDVVAIS